ncbi:hypothetical protein DYB31_006281 [Aphanomyces astaci]|uniref:START domain-containing protein n=1 Tax=Aphanomyces astaci TaxID=112090 RepID=A0A397FXV2_APHAT|nr:hypothetical protein DYB31_006281 [Aphanomyces astaci]
MTQECELLDDMEKRLKKRAYIRTFMKTYRKKEKRGHEQLKAQKVQLENEVRAMFLSTGRYVRTKTMLSWKDIASALATSKNEVLDTNQQLRAQVMSLHGIVQEMHHWVGIMRPLTVTSSWRNVSLPESPTSRSLAKDWISRQLLEQMNRVLTSQPFPADHAKYHDWDMIFSDDDSHFHIKQCSQFVWDVPIESVVTLYYRHTCSALWLDGHQPLGLQSLKEETEQTTLHQLISRAGEHVNLLSGISRGKDCCHIVLKQIQDDDSFALNGRRQRNRTAWLEIKRLSATKTQLRVYCETSQNFTNDGYTSVDVEAKRFSVDVNGLSDHMKRTTLRNTMVSRTNVALAMANDNMMKLLVQVDTSS